MICEIDDRFQFGIWNKYDDHYRLYCVYTYVDLYMLSCFFTQKTTTHCIFYLIEGSTLPSHWYRMKAFDEAAHFGKTIMPL